MHWRWRCCPRWLHEALDAQTGCSMASVWRPPAQLHFAFKRSWPILGLPRAHGRFGAAHWAKVTRVSPSDAGKLYTMYRVSAAQAGSKFDREVIVALDAQTGKTLWEDPYDAPFEPGMKMENGPGPHVTPLVVGNQIYTVGITGKFYCKDKNTGKTLWYHDLMKEYRAPRRDRGYSCSPVAYKQTVILPVGGTGQALMAFNQKDGSVAWKQHDLASSPSSPLIINVDGQDQLVAFLGDVIAGFDPNNGTLLWSHPHKTDWGLEHQPTGVVGREPVVLHFGLQRRQSAAATFATSRKDHRPATMVYKPIADPHRKRCAHWGLHLRLQR